MSFIVFFLSSNLTPYLSLSVRLKIAISFSLQLLSSTTFRFHTTLLVTAFYKFSFYLQWEPSPSEKLAAFAKFHPTNSCSCCHCCLTIPHWHWPHPQVAEPCYSFKPITKLFDWLHYLFSFLTTFTNEMPCLAGLHPLLFLHISHESTFRTLCTTTSLP